MNDQKFDNVSINDLECPYCQDQIDSLESHQKGFKNGELSSCKNCDLVIPNELCLSSHMQIVHKDAIKVFSCETCNIDFSSKKYLFIHKDLDQHLEKGVNDQITKSENFEVKTKINEEAVEDDLFADSTDTFEIWQSVKQKLECQQCQKILSSKENLLLHISIIHNGVKNFECLTCGRKFGYKKNLKKHIKAIHMKFEERNSNNAYKCDICEKTFDRKGNLKQHNLCAHSDLRPFKCDECPSTFKVRNHVTKHVKQVHQNNRKYQCDLCPMKFKSKSALNSHKDSLHSDLRTYKCDLCASAFKLKHSLKVHKESIHSDVRKYKCDLCPQQFKLNFNLTAHKLTVHTDLRKYKCDTCEKTFKQNTNLRKHLKFHVKYSHKENENTGCPRSKFATSNGYYLRTVHVRPQVGKAKMCLRDIHFCG